MTRIDEQDANADHAEDDTSPATSARFRIRIDAFGRVIPKVIRVDEDAGEKTK